MNDIMKKLFAIMLAMVLCLSAFALAEAASDAEYVDPHGELSFHYDPAAFEIADDTEENDVHNVTLNGINDQWGAYSIVFSLSDLDDGEAAPELGAYGDEPEASAEVTQGEWNGFEDVIQYYNATDDAHYQVFLVPVKDTEDGEIETVLSIYVEAQKLEGEDAAMDRDDAISNVLNSLKVLDD